MSKLRLVSLRGVSKVTGKFYTDGEVYYFVVREPQLDGEKWTCSCCNKICTSIWTAANFEKPKGAAVPWQFVPRSFLMFCMTRWPGLFERPVERSKK
jgi:hypothetical protein